MVSPPRDIIEVFNFLPEGTLAEVIEGILTIIPFPNLKHQEILVTLLSHIYDRLDRTGHGGQLYPLRTAVFLDDNKNVVQPDLIFIKSKNKSIIREDAIHGVPDLLVEILSDLNRNHDLRRKKYLYQRFGVPEYWVIDPIAHESIGYQIEDGRYVEFYRAKGKIKSKILKGVFKF